jgi:hypothetical protein
LAAVLLAGAFVVASGQSQAAPTRTAHGITITPAFQQVTIKPGETEHPLKLSVTNNEATTQTLELSAADFNTLNDTGGLLFVGANPTALQKKYGLAKWISLPEKQLSLAPGQTASIDAKILNLPDLTSGGHYGAIMISAGGQNQNASNRVSLHPVASSLLFVTKTGGDTHKLSLSDVTINHSLFHLPGSVTLRFHNDGNTHLIPRGTVTLTNSKGKLISKGIINDNSGIILPETFRKYFVPLQSVSHTGFPGRYTIKVDFRFDGIDQFREFKKSFLFIPAGTIIASVLIIAIIVFAVIKSWRHRRD